MYGTTTHLPSRVKIGGTRLADESVSDFHDQASCTSSTSFPFFLRFLVFVVCASVLGAS